MALICRVCKVSLSKADLPEENKLVSCPCGHVFHMSCVLSEPECVVCQRRYEPRDLITIYPIYREEKIDPKPSEGSTCQDITSSPPLKHYIIAFILFALVMVFGHIHQNLQFTRFEVGDDELSDAGTFLDNFWAFLFGFAGIMALILDDWTANAC